MGIERELIKEIHREIDEMAILPHESDSRFPDTISPAAVGDHIYSNDLLRSTEIFLNQPEDVVLEPIFDSKVLLGSYIPIQSPGVIILYHNNLKMFFWNVVLEILRQNSNIWIFKNDLKYVAEAIVSKVWWHEQFHFCCDVLRFLFGGKFYSLTEEALAVAYSRQQMLKRRYDQRSNISRIHPLFFQLVFEKIYTYNSVGYSDWYLYSDPESFRRGIVKYLMKNQDPLANQGIDLNILAEDMINSLHRKEKLGYTEKVI